MKEIDPKTVIFDKKCHIKVSNFVKNFFIFYVKENFCPIKVAFFSFFNFYSFSLLQKTENF